MRKNKLLFTGAAALGAGVAALTVSSYLRQKREATERLALNSQVAETARGPVEYAVTGTGPPVLVLHGAGGGYNQCVIDRLRDIGFQLLTPSRPGYLRTPLETGRDPDEQAAAFAALLDELGIDQVAVIGISAGGPPAIQFALNYPQRCWALVLISAVSGPLHHVPLPFNALAGLLPYADFPMWLGLQMPLIPVLGGPPPWAQARMDVERRALLRTVARSFFPLGPRVAGMRNDLRWLDQIEGYSLKKITAPALVIHGEADPLVPIEHGLRSAEAIPGAEFLPLPGGDHLVFITHLEQTKPALLEFLSKHRPEE